MCECQICGTLIEPPPDPQDARDAADEARAEDWRGRMAEREESDDYDYADDDHNDDAARERGIWKFPPTGPPGTIPADFSIPASLSFWGNTEETHPFFLYGSKRRGWDLNPRESSHWYIKGFCFILLTFIDGC